MLIHLGQPAAEGGDRPLQRRVAADERLLMGEVPDPVAPVLQVDVPQPGAGPTRISIAPQCKPSVFRTAAGRFGQQRRLGAFFEDHQRVAQIDAAVGQGREEYAAARRSTTPRGTYSSVPAGPAGRVQSGEACRSHGSTARPQVSGRIRSPCAATSSSRLPKSTPWSGPFGFKLARRPDGCSSG